MRDAMAARAWMLAAWSALALPAGADVVTDWDKTACDAVAAAKLGTPVAVRAIAVAQAAAWEAVKEMAGHKEAAGASVDAAVAAANRAMLAALLPTQKDLIEAAYRQTTGNIPDGDAKRAGIEAGERAAADLLARRGGDGFVKQLTRAAQRIHSKELIEAIRTACELAPGLR